MRLLDRLLSLRYSKPGNAARAFVAVAATTSSTSSPRTRAISAIVAMTFAGSLSRPRSFCGARNGLSVSTKMRSEVERLRGLTEVVVLRVRDVAGEAHPVAARRALARDVGVAAEAVDHHPLGRSLIQYSKDVGPRLADVDHEGLTGLVGQRDVDLEDPLLILYGRVHPEEVEAALPHPEHAGIVEQLLDPGAGLGVETAGVVGVHARRGEHPLDPVGQLERPPARFGVHAHADQPLDAGGLRGLDHIWRFAVHQEQVAVGIHRPRLHRQFRVLVAHRAATIPSLTLRSIRGASRETPIREDSPASGGADLLGFEPGEERRAFRRLGAGRQASPGGGFREALSIQIFQAELLPELRGGSRHDRRDEDGKDPERLRRGVEDARRARRGSPRPSPASTAPSRPGSRWLRATMSHTAASAGESSTPEHVRVEPRGRVGGDRGQVGRRTRDRGLGHDSRRSRRPSIASTRLARLPSPFARSALCRSTIDSQLRSCRPGRTCISRMK